ncbi:rhomboid family intramembrane serine protease [Myroides sp. LJL119]
MNLKSKSALIYKRDILIPLSLVALMWLIYFFQSTGLIKGCNGVVSWSLSGLKGIVFSPFLHGNFNHLWSNTIGILPLLLLTFIFYRKYALKILIYGGVLSGLLLWLMPSLTYLKTGVVTCHIGASGIIYMLISFLFFAGWFFRKFLPLVLSIVVGLIYYTVLMGVFPHDALADNISWQAHLAGIIAGFILAKSLSKAP